VAKSSNSRSEQSTVEAKEGARSTIREAAKQAHAQVEAEEAVEERREELARQMAAMEKGEKEESSRAFEEEENPDELSELELELQGHQG